MSTRRCPRCQAAYPAPARYCVKDGSPLVDTEPHPMPVAAPARPDDDFADAMFRVGVPVGILRREPLIGMLVPCKN